MPVLAVVPHMQSDDERRRTLSADHERRSGPGIDCHGCLAVLVYTLRAVTIPMYEEFFGLRERPFDLTPNPRFLVLTDSHREALSNLEYGIASRKGITLLIGEAGSGKTTMIRAAIDNLPARVHCVHLHNPALSRTEFVEMLAARFALTAAARAPRRRCCSSWRRSCAGGRAAGDAAVLIVDEAQSLAARAARGNPAAGQHRDGQREAAVGHHRRPAGAGRAVERSRSAVEAARSRSLRAAAARPQETAAIWLAASGPRAARARRCSPARRSHDSRPFAGIPRTISVLADNALLTGFAMERRPVNNQIVMDVCRDFDFSVANGVADIPATAPEHMVPFRGKCSNTAARSAVGARQRRGGRRADRYVYATSRDVCIPEAPAANGRVSMAAARRVCGLTEKTGPRLAALRRSSRSGNDRRSHRDPGTPRCSCTVFYPGRFSASIFPRSRARPAPACSWLSSHSAHVSAITSFRKNTAAELRECRHHGWLRRRICRRVGRRVVAGRRRQIEQPCWNICPEWHHVLRSRRRDVGDPIRDAEVKIATHVHDDLAVDGSAPFANPVKSALSAMTLMVRGMPCDRS